MEHTVEIINVTRWSEAEMDPFRLDVTPQISFEIEFRNTRQLLTVCLDRECVCFIFLGQESDFTSLYFPSRWTKSVTHCRDSINIP